MDALDLTEKRVQKIVKQGRDDTSGLQGLVDKIKKGTSEAVDKTKEWADDNPYTAAGLAGGAGIGLLSGAGGGIDASGQTEDLSLLKGILLGGGMGLPAGAALGGGIGYSADNLTEEELTDEKIQDMADKATAELETESKKSD